MEKLDICSSNVRQALHEVFSRYTTFRGETDAVWILLTDLGLEDKVIEIVLDVAKQFDLPREIEKSEIGDYLLGNYRNWTIHDLERGILDLIAAVKLEAVPTENKMVVKPLSLPADYSEMTDFEKKFVVLNLCRQAVKNAIAAYKGISPNEVFVWNLLGDYITSADIVPVLKLADINWCNEGLEISPIVADDVEETFGNEKWVSKTVGDFARNLPRLISYKKSEAMAKKR